jgi:hypothetical protein
MDFPDDMTEEQACDLSVEHWKRLTTDPQGCVASDEGPYGGECAFCQYDHQAAKIERSVCLDCPAVQFEKTVLGHSPDLCSGVLYGVAEKAWMDWQTGGAPVEEFQAAAHRVLARIEEVRDWVCAGKPTDWKART